MSPTIDQIMERASTELVAMNYCVCERLCLEALRLARAGGDFERYARILLPLQESRRLRRQTAVDAGVFVLAGQPRLSPDEILAAHPRGCVMLLSPPYTPADEAAVRAAAFEAGAYVEPLVMDQQALRQGFEQQMEREGDNAIAAIPKGLNPVQLVDALAAVLERIGDHEIAHQRLADAARAATTRR